MRWITASDLEVWAGSRVPARTTFSGLIGDLIRASAPDISAFRFPTGDKGQVRGFDGYLEAKEVPPFVPPGTSIWEFGVTKEDVRKADGDFEKRVAKISANDRSNMTFVFATPQTWDNPRKKIQDWIAEKKALLQWADVKYIDGSQLETWIENCPAVSARFARFDLGKYPHVGAQSSDEFWNEYASKFEPDLCEEALLCEREEQTTELLQKLGGNAGGIILAADSPDEVIAFAIAAIRKSPPAIRLFLEARILIVDSEEAARQLAGHNNLIFLARGQARPLSGLLSRCGPTLIPMGGDQPKRNYEVLRRPASRSLGKALTVMGFTEERAYQLARSCGRSVTILARLLRPSVNPEWLPEGRRLIPALLAGGWDSASTADREVLSGLAAGRVYTELETELQPFLRMQDPPIDREGTVWKMRAPVDAFVHLGGLIGEDNLTRLHTAATTVFSRIVEPPHPEKVFSRENEAETHSSWLRDGLANTLLQIAVLQDQAGLHVTGKTGQQFVNELIAALPGLARDYRLLVSLRDELPLLAEAAPDPFLAALERLLEGDGAAIKPIFDEVDNFLLPTSFHTGVLWALETLAWNPVLLPQVSMILARLAAIDPGGKLSNRPINSLREIFLAWIPNTNASLQQRLASIDQIIKFVPDIGWLLLLKLFPQSHDASMPNAKPRYREFGASDRETITNGLVWETQSQIITRALVLAGKDPERWVALIKALANFPPHLRAKTLSQVDAFLDGASQGDRVLVWSGLREQVNRHRAFALAVWALPEEELKSLDALVLKYRPEDMRVRLGWLFDDWMPDLPGSAGGDEARLAQARDEALSGVLAQQGLEGVLQLAHQVKLPQFIAATLGRVTDDITVFDNLIQGSVEDASLKDFVSTLSFVALEKFRDRWIEHLMRLIVERKWQNDDAVTLFLAWPDERRSWEHVSRLGEEVESGYWSRKNPWLLKGEASECEEAVQNYLKVGRATAGCVPRSGVGAVGK